MSKNVFVNREDELQRLTDCLNDARSGVPTFLFVSGEAGVGKATLIEEFFKLNQTGFAPFSFGASHASKSIPYHPFRHFAGLLSKMTERDIGKPVVGQVSKILGMLDARTSIVGDPVKERELLLEEFRRLLEELSADRTLVFFIDNLQWCDEGSVLLLQHLATGMDKGHILFLVTYRPEELEEVEDIVSPVTGLLATLMMAGVLNTLAVERFESGNTGKMISTMLEVKDLPDVFVEFIQEETEGSPMFVFELVKDMLEEGLINTRNPNWTEELDYERVRMPGGITEAISRRLQNLDEDTLTILKSASIIGNTFTVKDLAIITGRGREELSNMLSELVQNKIVYEELDSPEEAYAFDHSKIKDVLYDAVDTGFRKETHRKIGEMLEVRNRPLEFAYAMAHHFCRARDVQRGYRYGKLAGDLAYGSHAPKEAFDHYSRALSLIDSSELASRMTKERIELLNGIGNMGYIIGDWTKAISSLDEAISLAKGLGDKQLLLDSLILLGDILRYKGGFNERAISIFSEVLDISEAAGNHNGISAAHRGLGYVHWREGEFDEAIKHYKKCINSAKAVDDRRRLGEVYIEMGNAASGKGDLASATRYYKDSIEILETLEHYSELARAYNNLGDISLQTQEWDDAIHNFQKCAMAAEKIGYKDMQGWSLFNTAEALAKKGDLDKALEKNEKALAILAKLDDKVGLAGAEKNMGIIHRFRKEWDQAEKHFDIAVKMQVEMNMLHPQIETYIEYGLMYSDKGDVRKAKELLKKAIDLARQIEAKEFEKRARKAMKGIGVSR